VGGRTFISSNREPAITSLKGTINDRLEEIAPKLWLSLNILRRNRNFGPEYWLLPKLCRKDSIALDVGGNRGWFAYYMARLSSKVHVFEPNPICLSALERYKTPNMVIHEFALSDRAGVAKMRFDPNNTGIGTIETANSLTNNPGIREIVELDVVVKTLDSLDFSDVGFIKIDVEGHEPAVLRGAKKLLTASRPALLIELELRHNPAVFEEVWHLLDPLGYQMKCCTQRGLQPLDRARIATLQTGRPESNPDYVNNFVFVPPQRPGDANQQPFKLTAERQ
jgi:FkbM family methyltransferase